MTIGRPLDDHSDFFWVFLTLARNIKVVNFESIFSFGALAGPGCMKPEMNLTFPSASGK
jgi:hypothetical protein